MTKDLPQTAIPEKKTRRSYFAYAGLGTAALLFIAAIVVSRYLAEFDNAGANAVFAIGTLCALTSLYFAIVLSARFPSAFRVIVAVLPIAIVGLVAGMFRFEGLSGELVPQFRPRWTEEKRSVSNAILGKDAASASTESAASEDSSSLPSQDSPFYSYTSTQFFGNNRNGVHNDVTLLTDWSNAKPKELWRKPIGKGWASFAIKDGIAVTMEQSEDGNKEHVLALKLETGEPLWIKVLEGSHYRIEGGAGPRTTPTIDGDQVYVLSSAGKLAALDLKTGKELWMNDLLKVAGVDQAAFETEVSWGRSGSPLVVRELLIVPLGGAGAIKASLMAFDKVTGGRVWNSGKNQVSYSSPVLMTIDGTPQVVYLDEKTAAGYAAVDGQQLWEYSWDSHSNADASASQALQIDSTSLLLSKGYFQGCARIEVKQSEGRWRATNVWNADKSLKTKFTSCVLHAGHVFGLNDGKLECVNVEDGKRAWMKGRYGHGQVLLCNDLLLISSEEGALVLVAADPTQHRELARIAVLDGVTWNIPTLAKDIVITRNSSEAVCLQLPTVQQP